MKAVNWDVVVVGWGGLVEIFSYARMEMMRVSSGLLVGEDALSLLKGTRYLGEDVSTYTGINPTAHSSLKAASPTVPLHRSQA